MTKKMIHLVECPRDAMQGWKSFIPTKKKVEYINALLKVGFDTIDFGSFVSPKAIPQMADTKDVLSGLEVNKSNTRLLAIVANVRGAEEAAQYEKIAYLGFPFSVSETFQQRNTNSSQEESLERVEAIRDTCFKKGKQLVIYISMGFGNPYGDLYNEDIVFKWVTRMAAMDIKTISLADTVGVAKPEQVSAITRVIVESFPHIQIGVHLHSTSHSRQAKLDAALDAGCRRFDGALKGIGGCPMAHDELVGNMNTEYMIAHFKRLGLLPGLNEEALQTSLALAEEIFQS